MGGVKWKIYCFLFHPLIPARGGKGHTDYDYSPPLEGAQGEEKIKGKMEKAGPKNNWHYNKNLKYFANNLRKNMTKAEACLWKYALRAGNLSNWKFSRQRPVLKYIADFMCKDLLLIIEVDGFTHQWDETYEKDRNKEKDLELAGFKVLRFHDAEVLNDINNVIREIEYWIEKRQKELNVPPPNPRTRGKRS
jgi:very-short-patch-repair endonuclease